MPGYTRTYRPGGTFFFTVRTARRGSDVLIREVELLRHADRQTRTRHPFEIDELVVLGDVIHTIWTLPEGDSDFSTRWRMSKSLFSRGCPAPQAPEALRLRQGEKGIWQRRFWEHAIRDADDLAAHRQMIFSAPVQAGLVRRATDWPHSSVHRAVARGTYDPRVTVADAFVAQGGRTTPALCAPATPAA